MQALATVFAALDRSPFRRRFRLAPREHAYLRAKGMAAVGRHAQDLIAQRLAPAQPANDGRQTPFRGHPVFVAQHATATCCRSCLAKWHGIAAGRDLRDDERQYVVAVLLHWLERQQPSGPPPSAGPQLSLF